MRRDVLVACEALHSSAWCPYIFISLVEFRELQFEPRCFVPLEPLYFSRMTSQKIPNSLPSSSLFARSFAHRTWLKGNKTPLQGIGLHQGQRTGFEGWSLTTGACNSGLGCATLTPTCTGICRSPRGHITLQRAEEAQHRSMQSHTPQRIEEDRFHERSHYLAGGRYLLRGFYLSDALRRLGTQPGSLSKI